MRRENIYAHLDEKVKAMQARLGVTQKDADRLVTRMAVTDHNQIGAREF